VSRPARRRLSPAKAPLDARGIQEVRHARQRRRPRRRRHHRGGVRVDRHVPRARHHHAGGGALTGGLDFSNYYIALSSKVQTGAAYADAKKQGAVLGYGNFLTISLNFVIVAAVLFAIIRAMNRIKRQEDAKLDVAKTPELPADVKLLSEIRDLLAASRTASP
jgi:large-conductance mechanosensitive channel